MQKQPKFGKVQNPKQTISDVWIDEMLAKSSLIGSDLSNDCITHVTSWLDGFV